MTRSTRPTGSRPGPSPLQRLYPDGTTLVDQLSARGAQAAAGAVAVELAPRAGAVLVGA